MFSSIALVYLVRLGTFFIMYTMVYMSSVNRGVDGRERLKKSIQGSTDSVNRNTMYCNRQRTDDTCVPQPIPEGRGKGKG